MLDTKGKTDNDGALAPRFPRFLELPPELQDEIWRLHCHGFDNASMLFLDFVVEEMLDKPGTHAIYGTKSLRELTTGVRGFSGAHKRTYNMAQQLFPDRLRFYDRNVNINEEHPFYDVEREIRFNKQTDIIFFRHFFPLRNASGEIGLVNYQLGNFDQQAQNIAIEESSICHEDRRCDALIANLRKLKTVLFGIRANPGETFIDLAQHLLATSTSCYQMCASINNNTTLYIWTEGRSQLNFLDVFRGLNSLRDAASIRRWEVLPMAMFTGKDMIERYKQLENEKSDHINPNPRWCPTPFAESPHSSLYHSPSLPSYSPSMASSAGDTWIVPVEAEVALQEQLNMDELTRQERRARWAETLSEKEQPNMLDREARRMRWANILEMVEERLQQLARWQRRLAEWRGLLVLHQQIDDLLQISG